ncbi:MAG: 3-deoxy-manno-octulosonate cytidylyltransferase [Planctomycetaceae bacterium]|jgi:3-deoxy-manno-octulosonate cytidylyltransferase (CMP-KDO synthetase)|nr:3-deoxy-manno-octulosonate cytidylyltransferase [Planctomycetaceae bacterium]
MRVVGILPARLSSTRLARKPLLAETGKTLIQHTWEAASQAKSLDAVIVAADCDELAAAVKSFGGHVELTGEHPSGTDRIAEVVERCCPEAEIIVNIQGDEPEIDPAHVDAAVAALEAHPDWQMTTLVTPLTDPELLASPNVVKAVCADDGRALYFSRSVVPFSRDESVEEVLKSGNSPWRHHIGLYAYRREFLLQLTQLPPSPLEQLEKLEQLRALENGATIGVVEVAESAPGIDTPEDYQQFVARWREANAQ